MIDSKRSDGWSTSIVQLTMRRITTSTKEGAKGKAIGKKIKESLGDMKEKVKEKVKDMKETAKDKVKKEKKDTPIKKQI